MQIRVSSLFIACALICLYSCESTNDSLPVTTAAPASPSLPHYKLITGKPKTVGDITDIAKSVKKIRLSTEVAEKLGYIEHFYVVDQTDLILVDEEAATITRINHDGEIVWRVFSRSDDYRYYTHFDECAFDPFNERIAVHSGREVFLFDFSGNPVSVSKKPSFDYHQLAIASERDVVYSAQGLRNTHIMDESNQLFWVRDSSDPVGLISPVPYAPEYNFVGGMPQFTRMGGRLLYHAVLRDAFYEIDLPNVTPVFTFDLPGSITLEDVMKNQNIDNKLRFLFENNYPVPTSIGADDEMLCITYRHSKSAYLGLLDRKSSEWLINNEILRYDDLVFQAPLIENGRHLLHVMPNYQVAHYAKLAQGASATDTDWQEELSRLDEEYDDTGGKTIFLMEL
ncbi:hypothetical protein FUA23_22070 [Neolewinella aurantiaca]|uniref:6-bladed beta-propeller n=1 Tax=Neolewinella aurantiaca TaxID=2602767 RepID=A0A5C7EZ71_9BACT|nr:6-bladed beta-propeller [Neolewinella aurantiaca]TXF81178.1 hypothetical protein FUA23_22070 [Neolewinella aurantiaca]